MRNQPDFTLYCFYTAGCVPPVTRRTVVPPVCPGFCAHFEVKVLAVSASYESNLTAEAFTQFQALTLLELRPAACRQDVDEGRDVDSLGVLTCLKQSLKGHNSNTPVNTVLFSLFN